MAKHAKTDDERAAWMDGGSNKTILHGVVGAAMASLGGGNAVGGALGGASSDAVSHVMQQCLYDHNVQPARHIGISIGPVVTAFLYDKSVITFKKSSDQYEHK